jgi:outer membrane biosynthesis protein TonB
MRSSLPIQISVSLLLAALAARAQTAEDFFNSSAQFYISNNIPSALEKTEGGLKIYPDDAKLKKLEELLKQRQQSQQQQSQQNQQQSPSQKNPNLQKPDQNQPQKKQPSQNQSGQPKDQQPPEPKPADSSGKPDEEKKDGQEAPASAAKEMSPEEAKQLLDAQKGNEQLLQLQPPEKPRDNQKPVKDW